MGTEGKGDPLPLPSPRLPFQHLLLLKMLHLPVAVQQVEQKTTWEMQVDDPEAQITQHGRELAVVELQKPNWGQILMQLAEGTEQMVPTEKPQVDREQLEDEDGQMAHAPWAEAQKGAWEQQGRYWELN